MYIEDKRPDGPDVEDSFHHLLHHPLLEETDQRGHSRNIYCDLSEGVLVHVLLLVVEVLIHITPEIFQLIFVQFANYKF